MGENQKHPSEKSAGDAAPVHNTERECVSRRPVPCHDKCLSCWQERREPAYALPMRPMILCPTCGNKRCPKATHHDHPCSGSNEPGQLGSVYSVPPCARGAA
jgi:hypothetical protein